MRAATTLLVLALAPLATTRAEVVHLLEDFSDAQRFFTDAGASLGPGFWDSGAMNATTTEEGALRVDYATHARLVPRRAEINQPPRHRSRRVLTGRFGILFLRRYAELYRDRRGASAEAYALIEDKKDKLYPRTFAYRCRGTDGAAPTTEELPLFGDLIDAVDSCAEINERPS